MTVRARIALLYGALFLVGGLVLVSAVYLLVRNDLTTQLSAAVTRVIPPEGPVTGATRGPSVHLGNTDEIAKISQETVLAKLLVVSLLALALLVVLAAVAGWWISGRVLRPVHRMSELARRLSSDTLHERIALKGPQDELKELADTLDGLLSRLQAAFESRRRFIANASHELRTPLTVQRVAAQVGLSDVTAEQHVHAREQILTANRRSERLIDGLLVLARSDLAMAQRKPVPLQDVVKSELAQHTRWATANDITVHTRLDDCFVQGDPVLLPQLVGNLVRNAIEHNTRPGEIEVSTDRAGRLRISNTGPIIAPEHLPALFEPFTRGDERTARGEGSGLGLSIVQSIVQAHEADLVVHARDGGGLDVEVSLAMAEPLPTGRRS
ncbi:sensor histidine kinase [Kibdelosporangium aridum]|uniref:histidine kinase n=1 Tax=Kibdelosporangium aridum TaxID=2030 RepID=A0A1W2FVR1_KIBAR|nr:ATP-binding protein [Kibdelosporangium aridum]SMD25995.1 Signal transduction histidine kinase [Kibdelosporangium aridum]